MSEYTPEQLRDWAKVEEEMGEQEGPVRAKLRQHVADQLRAHAAALEARQAAEVRVRMTAQAERIQIERAQRAEAELASVKAHAEAMAEVLGWLNRLGGLGLDKHAQIEKVLVACRAAHPKDGS